MSNIYKGTATEQLHKDSEILEFYYERKKWDLLDSKLNEIIRSNNVSRMRFVLVIFKSFKDDPKLKDVLETIKIKVENQIGKIS